MRGATAAASRCCCSTSTASSTSTTAWATTTGDRVLIDVAERIKRCLRARRPAGAPGRRPVRAAGRTAPTRRRRGHGAARAGRRGAPYALDGAQFTLTCSIGVALYPSDGHSADELVRHAEGRGAGGQGRRPWRLPGVRERQCDVYALFFDFVVLLIVHGTAAPAGTPLTGHPDVDRVAFTGSPATARTVYRDAAAQLTPVSFVGARRQVALPRLRRRDLDAAARRRPTSTTTPARSAWPARACSSSAPSSTTSWALGRGSPRSTSATRDAPGTTYGPLIHPGRARARTAHVARALERAPRSRSAASRSAASTTRRRSSPTSRQRREILRTRRCSARSSRCRPSTTRTRPSGSPTPTDYGLAATVYTGSPERAAGLARRSGRRGTVVQLLLRPRPRDAVRRERRDRASAAKAATT